MEGHCSQPIHKTLTSINGSCIQALPVLTVPGAAAILLCHNGHNSHTLIEWWSTLPLNQAEVRFSHVTEEKFSFTVTASYCHTQHQKRVQCFSTWVCLFLSFLLC